MKAYLNVNVLCAQFLGCHSEWPAEGSLPSPFLADVTQRKAHDVKIIVLLVLF
jgi:hypothetical protein